MLKNDHSFNFFLQVQRILIDGTIQTASKNNYILPGGTYTYSHVAILMHVEFLLMTMVEYLLKLTKVVGLKDALPAGKSLCS